MPRCLIYNRITCTFTEVKDKGALTAAFKLRQTHLRALDVRRIDTPAYSAAVISYRAPTPMELLDIHVRIAEHISDTTYLT